MAAAGYEMGFPGLDPEVGEALLDALNEDGTIRYFAAAQFNEHHRMCIAVMREPLARFLARGDLRPDAREIAEQALREGDRECGERGAFEYGDGLWKHPDAGSGGSAR